jgi:molybdopterin converting factor small subunit
MTRPDAPAPQVRLELFGIPRVRAGVAWLDVRAATLGEALQRAVEQAAGLAEICSAEGLRPGYAANLGGQRFVTDPNTRLTEGEAVLILSADLGG